MNTINKNIFTVLFLVLGCFLVPTLMFAQPSFSKTFSVDNIGLGNITTLTYTINNSGGGGLDQIAFTDNLPVGMVIATPSNATISCEGDLSASDGGSIIALTGGRLPGGQVCTITIDVMATATPTIGSPTMLTSTTGDLTSSAGNSGTATDDLTISAERPGFIMDFTPNQLFSVGQKSRLTFTIDNSLNPSGLSTLNFTNNLPAGIQIADIPNASTDCGASVFPASLTANPSESKISLFANGFLPSFPALSANATCTIGVDVVGTAVGQHINTTEELSIGILGSVGKASDILEVQTNSLDMLFLENPVAPEGTTTLQFTINNRDRSNSLTDIAFTNDLGNTLAGLTFSSLVSNDCGGTVTGVGTTNIGFSGGTVAAGSSCTCQVEVMVPSASTPGDYINTTSNITGMLGGDAFNGNIGQDILSVSPAPILTQMFMSNPVGPDGTAVLEFTVKNTSPTSSATDITFENTFPTILTTASIPPPSECLGAGSNCTFIPLFNPTSPCNPCDGIPAKLTITGGTLAPAGMAGDEATFSISLNVASDAEPGTYLNSTSSISAVVDGATRIGKGASDDLIIATAPTLRMSYAESIIAPGQQTTLEFTLTHSENAAGPATGITFSNDLDAFITGMTATLPATPDPACGIGSNLVGSVGNSLLSFMGGSLNPGESCTFSVEVDIPTNAAAGLFTNTISGVSAMVGGVAVTSAATTSDLTISPLKVTQEFIGNPALPEGQVTLRYNLENLSTTGEVSSILFTNNFGGTISGLAASSPLPSNPCGANSSLSGTNFLIFFGGSLTAGSSCSFDILIDIPAGVADGSYGNSTSEITYTFNGASLTTPSATSILEILKARLAITKEFTDDPVLVGTSGNVRYTIKNLDTENTITSIAFTDDLDAALSGLTATGLPISTCGGNITANPDAGTIEFLGGNLGPDGECQFDIPIAVPAGATPGVYPSTTSTISGMIGSEAVTGTAASDDLAVTDIEVSFTKTFSGATLTYTLTNLSSTQSVANLKFTDDLDAALTGLVATGLPKTDICGAGTQLSGTSLITFTGGNLAPSGTCTFSVDLSIPSGAATGTYESSTSPLTSNGLAVSKVATADLTIVGQPGFSMAFAKTSICQGESTTLTYTIDNSARSTAANNLSFTNNLPAGLVIATTPNAMVSCTGGTLTAVAGSSTISYSGGSVAASTNCTIQVDVTGNTVGSLMNTTGDLTTSAGNSGTATQTLTVNTEPLISGRDTSLCGSGAVDLSTLLNGTSSNTLEFGTSLSTFSLTKDVNPTSTTTYYVRDSNMTTMCADTARIIVTIGTQPLITGQNTTICEGASADLSTLLNGTPLNMLTYGTSLSALNLSKDVMPTTTTTYYVRDSNTTTMCADTAKIIVTVIDSPSGTPLSGSESVCGNMANSVTMSLGSFTGTVIKWQSANNAAFNNPVDISETTTSLTVENVATTTYYRVVFQSGVCSNLFSATATISIDNTDSDDDTVPDCLDVCPGGDDRINTDETGMPDFCDCDANDPNDEFVVENGIPEINNTILPGTYRSSFELKSLGMVPNGINVEFVAGHQIIIEPGFIAQAGSGFIARIERCDELNTLTDDAIDFRASTLTIPNFGNLDLTIAPNPFNEYATISFTLEQAKKVSLRLYNQSGQMVQSIYQHQLTDVGYHETSVNTAHLPEGLYLFSLSLDGKIITKRTILAK